MPKSRTRAKSVERWWASKKLLATLQAEWGTGKPSDAAFLTFIKKREGYGVRHKNFRRKHELEKQRIEQQRGKPMTPREEILLFIKNVVKAQSS